MELLVDLLCYNYKKYKEFKMTSTLIVAITAFIIGAAYATIKYFLAGKAY
jgi:hypothetical protein